MTQQWVHCPICGGKTRTKIREDTEAKNLPVLCKICKKESVVDIKDGKAEITVPKMTPNLYAMVLAREVEASYGEGEEFEKQKERFEKLMK